MASASTAPLTSIAQATSFEQLCDIEDLVYPSDDKAVKDLLAASAVQLPPDCNLSKNVASVKKSSAGTGMLRSVASLHAPYAGRLPSATAFPGRVCSGHLSPPR